MRTFILEPSKNQSKKFAVYEKDGESKKTINFGASGYEDYTMHKDEERKERYINRHKSRENWTKSGIMTAGWWSRWILWNKPSLTSSIKDAQSKFNIKIIRKR